MKKLVLPMVFGIVLSSCSRDEAHNVIPNVKEESTAILPIENQNIRYNYVEGNKLASIVEIYKSGDLEVDIKYDGDLIKSIGGYSFKYDSQQRLINVKREDMEINYFYDKDKPYSIKKSGENFTKITYNTDANGVILGANGIFYDEDPSTLISEQSPRIVTIKLEYDDKMNMMRNVKGLDKISIFLIDDYNIITQTNLGGKNNLIAYEKIANGIGVDNAFEGQAFKYEKIIYNEQGYPISYYIRHPKNLYPSSDYSDDSRLYGPNIVKYNK